MAVRGRKPKPTAKKILQGNPGRRPLPKNEPKPKTVGEVFEPPSWMLAEAKDEWRRVLPELRRSCGLALIDRAALAAYCQLWARFVEGEQKNKPVNAAKIAQMRALQSSLGLEPSSRSRLSSSPPGESGTEFDELDQLSAPAGGAGLRDGGAKRVN